MVAGQHAEKRVSDCGRLSHKWTVCYHSSPPQPRLKDHPVKNGEKEWESQRSREDPSKTVSSGLGVISVVTIPQQLWLPAQDPASQPSIVECEGDS